MTSSPRHRREGFAGQHMVVVPEPVTRDSASHPLLAGLRVTDAGFFPRAAGHRVERPEGASTCLLILCVSGAGRIRRAGGRPEAMRTHDVAWLAPSLPHLYEADSAQPWSIAWVHFEGAETEAWRRHLQFPREGGRQSLGAETSAEVAAGLQAIYRCLEFGYTRRQLVLAASLLRTALGHMALQQQTAPLPGNAAARVSRTIDWMRTHLAARVQVKELAAMAGLSVPHYNASFRKLTGYPPLNYLLRLRIQRACQRLDTTSERIAEIAQGVGFEDAYYFSRMFRAIMGRSPRDYRKQRGFPL